MARLTNIIITHLEFPVKRADKTSIVDRLDTNFLNLFIITIGKQRKNNQIEKGFEYNDRLYDYLVHLSPGKLPCWSYNSKIKAIGWKMVPKRQN